MNYKQLDKAKATAKLNAEKQNDALHGRRPLTYEQIQAKINTITTVTPDGDLVAPMLAVAAKLFKDQPGLLYDFYLLEVKQFVPPEPVVMRVVQEDPVVPLRWWQRLWKWLF